MEGLTWTCHVCGKVRPDDAIGVVSRQAAMGVVEVKHSLRYCSDDGLCKNAADEWAETSEPLHWHDGLVTR